MPGSAGPLQAEKSYGQLPLCFEPNQGQADPQAKFISRGNGYTLFITSKEAVLVLNKQGTKSIKGEKVKRFNSEHPSLYPSKPWRRGANSKLLTSKNEVVRMRLSGSNPHPVMEGLGKLSGISNYFIGKDPSKWRTNIPNYAKVRIKDVYPGIDMVYYGNSRHLEYDFVVAPGADPKVIHLALEGNQKFRVDSAGNLILKTGNGELAFKAPVVYQTEAGQKKPVEGRFVMAGKRQIGFEVRNYDSSQPLVIDPVLDYSTYLGGNISDVGYGIAVDSSGNAYVAGTTQSTNFPTTAGAFQTSFGGSSDAFVAKLNPSGTGLVYSTYLGGNGGGGSFAIAVDPGGNVYVAGGTGSTNFPTTAGAFQATMSGSGPAFVTKLNATGSGLLYSTYLGGNNIDNAYAIAVDSGGNAYVTGFTTSTNFPTTAGGFQTVKPSVSGQDSVFVTKLNSNGTGLVYSTFLGGSTNDMGHAIALDAGGNAYMTGFSQSTDFPTMAGAYQSTKPTAAYQDTAFVTKLNSAGTSLVYSTFLGGSGGSTGYGIAVDPSGAAYVTGDSGSNFPTTAGAFQTVFGGGTQTVFVAKLNPTGTGLVYSTYLGGNSEDIADGIAVDPGGKAFVTGNTTSTNFPTTAGAFQTANGGYADVFVAKLNPAGTGLIYSTYLGGSGSEMGYGIALDPNGSAYVTGITASTNFPTTTAAFQNALAGTENAFVVKFDATAFYTPTPTPSYFELGGPAPGTSFTYPSPAKEGGIVSIAYDMEEGGTAQVLVWNESAELVADITQNQWVGTQKTTISLQGWARGVYFYRVVLHYNSGKTDRLPPDKFFVGWR